MEYESEPLVVRMPVAFDKDLKLLSKTTNKTPAELQRKFLTIGLIFDKVETKETADPSAAIDTIPYEHLLPEFGLPNNLIEGDRANKNNRSITITQEYGAYGEYDLYTLKLRPILISALREISIRKHGTISDIVQEMMANSIYYYKMVYQNKGFI